MTASALHYMGAAEQARRVKAREVSAREVTRAHLDRIAAVDARLGAFLHVDAASALARADEIDQAVARGEDPGPLAGVSIALKDVLVTRGMPTTAASRILDGWIPPYDGTAVARLRAAGAVLLGKLNMDEFAMGSSTENSSVRPCANPWDLARVPGGSSGGSAAAVAAGLCAASLGTDTGGSIRQPAALCGVVGLKPTYGRVSRYGVVAFASSLDQVGPLGRSVEDVALMLDAIAGFDPHDSTSITEAPPGFAAALDGGDARGLVIGRPREYDLPGVEPEVAAAVDRAVEVLVSLGAEVREVSLPHAEFALPTYYLLAPAEASSNLARYDGVRYGARTGGADGLADMYARTRGAGFGAEVKRRIMLGTFALRSGYYDAYYKKAQQVRALIARDFARAFDSGVHLIASPTSPTAAFRLGEKAADPMAMYLADVFTLSCNLAGLPGISVPCGQTGAGLPVGLQLVGRALDEVTVLRAAAAYEAAGGHAARRPPEAALRRGSPQANDDDAPAATSSGDLSGGTR